MKTIYFIRSAPYDYLVSGLNLYQSFNAVIKKEYYPPLLSGGKELLFGSLKEAAYNVDKVYSSPDPRCIQTGKFLVNRVEAVPILREVGYVMENFMSETDFFRDGKPDVNRARSAFINALIEDKLDESYTAVIARIKKFLNELERQKQTRVVCITHGFLLKIIEMFLRYPEIEKAPRVLLEHYNGSEESFKFCEGIIVTIDKQISVQEYIRQK